jgi:DNA invertase Pin-like site-specific DNA recombinase
MASKLVAYYRVSTDRQEQSGLGLEGQVATVQDYAARSGSQVVAEFRETESGRKNKRPQLARALAHAKRIGAKLCIAKIDRLTRNLHFLTTLEQGNVDFVVCDAPNADRTMLRMMVVFAEREADLISERTRAALAAYKARGGKLGASLPQCRNLGAGDRVVGSIRGAQAMRAKAIAAVADLVDEMKAMRAAGVSLRAIADHLNAEGHTTRTGAAWSAVQVMRALDRSNLKEGLR